MSFANDRVAQQDGHDNDAWGDKRRPGLWRRSVVKELIACLARFYDTDPREEGPWSFPKS
jgi:hypothetical protein